MNPVTTAILFSLNNDALPPSELLQPRHHWHLYPENYPAPPPPINNSTTPSSRTNARTRPRRHTLFALRIPTYTDGYAFRIFGVARRRATETRRISRARARVDSYPWNLYYRGTTAAVGWRAGALAIYDFCFSPPLLRAELCYGPARFSASSRWKLPRLISL